MLPPSPPGDYVYSLWHAARIGKHIFNLHLSYILIVIVLRDESRRLHSIIANSLGQL